MMKQQLVPQLAQCFCSLWKHVGQIKIHPLDIIHSNFRADATEEAPRLAQDTDRPAAT